MRSPYTRKQYFKKHFNYIEPVEIYFDTSEIKKAPKFYYVPVLETLTVLIKNPIVYEQWLVNTGKSSDSNVIKDIPDGYIFKQKLFFKDNVGALRSILYQDAFEVCNPLGSSRKIHKVIGVYMVLENVFPYDRSQVDHIYLVALSYEAHVKKYGFSKFLGRLIRDLKVLEHEGIFINDATGIVKGYVIAMVGDNLGSHQIGGFVENFFANEYLCRYCHITKTELRKDAKSKGTSRSKE